MRVAIAGASGFVGQLLIRELQDDFDLIALGRNSRTSQGSTHSERVVWRSCDLFALLLPVLQHGVEQFFLGRVELERSARGRLWAGLLLIRFLLAGPFLGWPFLSWLSGRGTLAGCGVTAGGQLRGANRLLGKSCIRKQAQEANRDPGCANRPSNVRRGKSQIHLRSFHACKIGRPLRLSVKRAGVNQLRREPGGGGILASCRESP